MKSALIKESSIRKLIRSVLLKEIEDQKLADTDFSADYGGDTEGANKLSSDKDYRKLSSKYKNNLSTRGNSPRIVYFQSSEASASRPCLVIMVDGNYYKAKSNGEIDKNPKNKTIVIKHSFKISDPPTQDHLKMIKYNKSAAFKKIDKVIEAKDKTTLLYPNITMKKSGFVAQYNLVRSIADVLKKTKNKIEIDNNQTGREPADIVDDILEYLNDVNEDLLNQFEEKFKSSDSETSTSSDSVSTTTTDSGGNTQKITFKIEKTPFIRVSQEKAEKKSSLYKDGAGIYIKYYIDDQEGIQRKLVSKLGDASIQSIKLANGKANLGNGLDKAIQKNWEKLQVSYNKAAN
jgi:hypothetical protein